METQIPYAPGTRVIAALSGGVDSSVAMALAKKAGLDVVGVMLQLWDYSEPKKFGTCCASRDIADARAVCDSLEVPFYVIDSNKVFKEKVVDYFAQSYEAGLTPNPCVLCNSKVKFQILADVARDMNAKAIITGHYTRIIKNPETGHNELFRGDDRMKDQSYFLFGLDQEILDLLWAPLGCAKKDEVRELAEKFSLTNVSKKKDSQELCFLGTDRPQEFIEKHYKKKFQPAKIIDFHSGEVLGTHLGIANVTVGQRRGLAVAAGERQFVVKVDVEKNIIYLGNEEDLYSQSLQVHWVKKPPQNGKFMVKIRYRHEGSVADVKEDGTINFFESQRAITKGQAAVAYDEQDRLVAGGFIL